MSFSSEKIDEEKLRIEASVIPNLKKVFAHMAQDAETLYRTTGRIPEELAVNYYPEFLKEIRDAIRKAIKKFGFELRETLETKHSLFFDAEFKKTLIDLEFKKQTKIIDESVDHKLEAINNAFLAASTFFIANQSEAQATFVEATNAKELMLAMQQEEILFVDEMLQRQNEINNLRGREATVDVRQELILREQIATASRQMAESSRNSKAIIAKNIRINLIDRSQARSELIASQNVGMTEAWARQTEAQLINDAGLVMNSGKVAKVMKTWLAILDSKTRFEHVQADHQQVEVSQPFLVGGESLMYPRDPNGSAANTINCRCVSNHSIEG